MDINPGDTVRLLSGGGTWDPKKGTHLVKCKNDHIYKVGGTWKHRGIIYITLLDESNVCIGQARAEQLSKEDGKGMNEIESIKRRLQQLKARMTMLYSYKGWLYVCTEDGKRIYEDTVGGELSTLIKKLIKNEVDLMENWLKAIENEPKS
ncbi:hypothetical protein ABNF65_03555 [Paenibacillus larvae]